MIQTRLGSCNQPPAVQQDGLSNIIKGCKKSKGEKLEKAMADFKNYILELKAKSAGAGAKTALCLTDDPPW
jgi:hypothetical protein